MAVPKRKVSKSKKRMRRANKGYKMPALAIDPIDGTRYMRHCVNPHNGMYKGRQVINPEIDED